MIYIYVDDIGYMITKRQDDSLCSKIFQSGKIVLFALTS